MVRYIVLYAVENINFERMNVMPINEEQTVELSKKIEEVISSTNFANVLETYDPYLYEQLLLQGFEQLNMPSDIELDDVEGKELKLENNLNSEAWAELLGRTEVTNINDYKKLLESEEVLQQAMLLHMDNRFKATVIITEELREIRGRKPDIKTLSDELENSYDEYAFIEVLEENKKEQIKERVRETASDEGVPQSTPIEKIPYALYVNLTIDFDTLAERYLEEAIEYGNTRNYAVENVSKILLKENAYEINPEVELDRIEE